MNRTIAKYRTVLCALLLVMLTGSAAGQTETERRQAEGKAAFDEAIRLRGERTFNSYQQAFEKFQLSAKIYEELGDKPNVGSALLGMGLIKSLIDENPSALGLYLQALAIFREAGVKQLEARTLNNLGRLYQELGDKQKALEYHSLALPLREETADKFGLANTLNSIGSVYLDLGERARAIGYFERALAIQIDIDEKNAQAITLSNLGRTYDDLGDEKRAIEYLERSLTLRRAVGDKGGQATVLNNIGMAKADLDDLRGAIGFYEQALVLLSAAGFETRKASVLNNIAVAHLSLNEPAKALEYSLRTLPLYQAMSDKQGEATALNNIGFAYARLDNTAAAFENLNNALVMARVVKAKPLEAIILGNLMRVSRQTGRNIAAVLFGKQCVGTYQELRRAIDGLESTLQSMYLDSVAENYRVLADLLIELGRFAEAEAVLHMLKEEEYAQFVRRDADEIKSLDKRVVLNEREQMLIDRYQVLADKTAAIGEQFRKLDDRKRMLSRRDQKLSTDEEALYRQLSEQVADVNAAFKLFLEKQLINELGKEAIRKIDIDRNLQTKLRKWGSGTVAIHTVVTEDRYRVVLTTPTIQIDGKYEIKAADLNKKIFAFRAALQNPQADPLPNGKELYDILIKPIERELKAAGAKTLVWSLDGTLRYIPLAALSPDGKAYLVEKFQNVILTPKTRDDLSDVNTEWRALGMGVSAEQMVTYPDRPDRRVHIAALPGTKAELSAIVRDETNPGEKGILNGRRFIDGEFTLGNLTDSLAKETVDGKRKFTVAHFATHFSLGGDWSSSYLYLGGSKLLSLEELSSSPEITFDDVELVTLSACNTAIGTDSNGGEVDSLADAIQTKGGKAVMATLWEVYDDSTAKLMTEFYRLRKERPAMTKAEAIQKAQLSLMQSKRGTASAAAPFAHPYYWSGFVLIGNWR